MKVLQINTVCGVGSTGRIATDIHAILKEQGYESFIAYGRGMARNCEKVIKIGTSTDNYVHVAKTRFLDKHGFGSIRATKEFLKTVKKLDPDVIHLHNIHGYYLNMRLLFEYLKETNKPVVWTLHDCWAITGHCSHFDYIGCEKWKSGCYSCPQKNSYPSSWFLDNSLNNYREKREMFTSLKNLVLVTPSQWLSGLVEQSFLKKYPIEVINNGINTDVFKPTISNFKSKYSINDKFLILGVANVWGEKKGYHNFLELSKRLNQDEVILLLGLNDKQINELPNNIIGLKRTESIKELAEIYTASDVYVNLTLEDNFPTTNLEAMACGTPVLTFNTGGSPETLNSKWGFVIEKENIDELVEKIRWLKEKIENKALKNSLVKHVNEFYDKSTNFMEYINLYESIYM